MAGLLESNCAKFVRVWRDGGSPEIAIGEEDLIAIGGGNWVIRVSRESSHTSGMMAMVKTGWWQSENRFCPMEKHQPKIRDPRTT